MMVIFKVCINFIHVEQKINWNHIKKVRENKTFYDAAILSEYTKVLESYQYHKSDKISFNIYADLKTLFEKSLSPTKVSEHIPGFSMSTVLSFKNKKISIMNTEKKVLKIFKRGRNEDN